MEIIKLRKNFTKMKNSLLSIALFGLVAAQGMSAGEKEPRSDFELFVDHGQKNAGHCLKRGMFYDEKGDCLRAEYRGNSNDQFVSWEWQVDDHSMTLEEKDGLSAKALKQVMNEPLKEREGRIVREVMMGDELWVCNARVALNADKTYASVLCSPLSKHFALVSHCLAFMRQVQRSSGKQKQDWKDAEQSLSAKETSKDLKGV
jgi:hypothetical protein